MKVRRIPAVLRPRDAQPGRKHVTVCNNAPLIWGRSRLLVRVIALGLTVLTGFSGLVYEVTWQKYLATLLGSHSEATAAVLALFLGGLSIGYSLFGAVTRRVVQRAEARGEAPRLLLLYGLIESGIGLTALLFPLLFRGVRALSLAIPHQADGVGFALDVLLSALLILPPSVLMGGTIPILTQALSRSLADATRLHAQVYAFNTAGAFVGALAASFVLIPWLGLERVVIAMGVVNLAAGSTFLALGGKRASVAIAPAGDAANAAPIAIGLYAIVALLVGFAAMCFQTVLIRVAGLSLGSSNFTFSMVVAVFVLCIALGSFAVASLPRIPGALIVTTQWLLAIGMGLLYVPLNYAPYWAHLVRSWFRDIDAAFYPYHLTVFALALAILAIPVGLSGAALPLIFHHLKREVGDLGAAAGKLYSWNTVGSLLGALLGGYLLFFWLDLDGVYRVALAAVVLAATLLTIQILALPRIGASVLLLAPSLAVLAVLPRWDPNPLAAATFRMRHARDEDRLSPQAFFKQVTGNTRIAFYDDDPNSSVAVREQMLPDGPDPSIVTNGKPDGSVKFDYPTMALAALIPSLFAEQAEHGFVIGFGTGVTVGELAKIPTMKDVTIAEISPGVIEAGRFFEAKNQHALHNGKTRVVVSDAYRALLRSEQRYDVIASEPSNPWVTGIEMLFSQEFLSAAKDRMRPGGVYAQWFHCYENDTSVVELVLRTYASVFDHVAVWYTLGPDVILLGFKDPDVDRVLDVRRLQARYAQPAMRAALKRAGIDNFPALLVHELLPLGVVNAAGWRGDVHTILHPVLSYRAARAFFRGQQAELPLALTPAATAVGAKNSLLEAYRRRNGGALSDTVHRQLVEEACKTRPWMCATLFAQWYAEHAESPDREELLLEQLKNPPFRRHLTPTVIQSVIPFFHPDLAATEPIEAREADRLSELFIDYYFHGAPFAREALVSIWQRCEDGGGKSCREERASIERRVGSLGNAPVALSAPRTQ
jgi:predicted membrane-bound spermidine synthase